MAIYAIQVGAGGPVKFGVTSGDVRKRFSSIQTANHMPLRLAAVAKDGDEAGERLLHDHLAAHRIRGEWYRATVPVLEMIRLMREGRWLQCIALEIAEDYSRAVKALKPTH